MGGGGAMRTAARVTGFSILNGNTRGLPQHVPLASTSSKAAASRSNSVAVSVSNELSTGDFVESRIEKEDGLLHKNHFGNDDWVFAEGGEEIEGFLNNPYGEPLPRLVFGGVPSIQEAQEATSELKYALEKVYLSPSASPETKVSCTTDQEALLLPSVDSKVAALKNYASYDDSIVAPPMPKHAIQAFKLLSESSVAQNVVASIASDPNVWNAVLQNEALVGYLEMEKTCTSKDEEESVNQPAPEAESFHEDSCSGESASENGVKSFMLNIKLKVVSMMNGLSGFFQNLFGGSMAEKTSVADDARGQTNVMGEVFGASFIALAIMVIVTVVLRRN